VRGRILGSLELARAGPAFSPSERLFVRAAADALAAALRSFGGTRANGAGPERHALALAGEGLAAGSDERRTSEEIVRLAAEASGAAAAVLWRRSDEEALTVVAGFGARDVVASAPARALAERSLAAPRSLAVERTGTDGGAPVSVVTLPVGEPPRHALQLFFAAHEGPAPETLAVLTAYGVRAAHALRAREEARTAALELQRSRALLALVTQVTAELSLEHTLETVIERLAELLEADRLAIYLRSNGRAVAAASRGLDGPHAAIGERLLELALGPVRARAMMTVVDARADARLRGLEAELRATGIEAAAAVPLVVPDGVTGLLAIYQPRGTVPSHEDTELLTAVAAQLAVAVENARLHERATTLGAELEEVLALERQAARQLRALYEISRSFVQSLSLEATLDAVARTMAELLDVDAAVIRMPDARGDLLVAHAIHVSEPELEPALRPILSVPQRVESVPGRARLRGGEAIRLEGRGGGEVGHELLAPFLRNGATAVVVPISTQAPGRLLGTITLVSLDTGRRVTDEATALALTLAGQAALAIDNARLYQHQKYFTDTMQRSLLPRTLPNVAGFRVGAIYASSATLELGGDVYDYMTLPDDRLAVVLGDVTGHGVEATADMAMAKFVFRSLAREHSEPDGFLAAANEVVCGEISAGKFLTMLYVLLDPASGEIACASAGHPAPRVVHPDGSVRVLEAGGLALGIDRGQSYDVVRAELPAGASVVLYTDGVIEARQDGELYGTERLDALLSRRAALVPQDLAAAIIADCRRYGGGELQDDCAVVVIKRTAG
jgi:serine phosphatase RsbU (regulator of sigma subunit)